MNRTHLPASRTDFPGARQPIFALLEQGAFDRFKRWQSYLFIGLFFLLTGSVGAVAGPVMSVLPKEGGQRLAGETIELRFVTQLNCTTGQYTATIQARAASSTSFSIGNSSILFEYDPSSLTFVSYTPLNFNSGGWDVQAYDGSLPGFF